MKNTLSQEVCGALDPPGPHYPEGYKPYGGSPIKYLPKREPWTTLCGIKISIGWDQGYREVWMGNASTCQERLVVQKGHSTDSVSHNG